MYRVSPLFLLTVGVLFHAGGRCAPLSEINADAGVETDIDISDTEEVIEDDDSTTHALDRLSSAATCLVAGVEYTHGQQIYRKDPCEFCLCLDGEMFCWWQDCPPTLEGPCRDRLPFSPCANGPRSLPAATTAKAQRPLSSTQHSVSSSKSWDMETTSASKNYESSSSSTSLETTESESQTETSTLVSTQETPKVCIIMGKEYEIGASLPHDTGNCVECICGPGAQVTCSPHQCAPAGDDIDYRPPGPRPPLPDTF